MSLFPSTPQNQRYLPDTGLDLKGFDGPDYFTSNMLHARRHSREAGRQEGESVLWSSHSSTAKAAETVKSDSPLPRDATLGESRRFHDCKISMNMDGYERREPSYSAQSNRPQLEVLTSTSTRPRALAPLSSPPKQPQLKIGRHDCFTYGDVDLNRPSLSTGHPSPPLMSLRLGPVGF